MDDILGMTDCVFTHGTLEMIVSKVYAVDEQVEATFIFKLFSSFKLLHLKKVSCLKCSLFFCDML